jgi:hypothetical protein
MSTEPSAFVYSPGLCDERPARTTSRSWGSKLPLVAHTADGPRVTAVVDRWVAGCQAAGDVHFLCHLVMARLAHAIRFRCEVVALTRLVTVRLAWALTLHCFGSSLVLASVPKSQSPERHRNIGRVRVGVEPTVRITAQRLSSFKILMLSCAVL